MERRPPTRRIPDPASVEGAEARIVNKVFQFRDKAHQEKSVEWLQSMGCKLTHCDGDVYVLKGLVGVICGLNPKDDPVTVAVQFGFLLAGPYWPKVYPKLLSRINKRWKLEKRK